MGEGKEMKDLELAALVAERKELMLKFAPLLLGVSSADPYRAREVRRRRIERKDLREKIYVNGNKIIIRVTELMEEE